MRPERFVVPVLRSVARHDRAAGLLDRVLRPWNPFSPARYEDPYPRYAHLRAEIGQLAYQRTLGGWNVVGYDACEEVLRTPAMSVDRSELLTHVPPYRNLSQSTMDLFMSTMLMKDPPDHTRLRTLVNRAFTPRQMAALEPDIEKIAHGLLHDIAHGDEADVIESFCAQLPIHVISKMLGFPPASWDEFRTISDSLVQFIDPISSFVPHEMERTVRRFREMLGELVTDREREPQDDMVSRLVEAHDDGDRLDRSELESMVAILMVAGHETTASLLGNSLLALQLHPLAKDRLRTEPDIAANAVEELLRYDAPVQLTDRFPTADVEVAGHTLKKGQLVGLFLGAANRDPARYERPDELILDREDPRPLSFGHGIHHCLGAALARLEARVALPLFLQTFPNYRIDTDRVEWKRSFTVRGPKSLPTTIG